MTTSRTADLRQGLDALLVLDLFDQLPGAGLNGELHDVATDALAVFAERMTDAAGAADADGNADLASGCSTAAQACRTELAARAA